jgi:hypothetical protein
MPNILKITTVVTAQDILNVTTLNTTPLQGGFGREAILRCPVLPLTSEIKVQGAGRTDSGDPPAEESDAWTDIVTLSSSSPHEQEIELPLYLRMNVTTADADGPDVTVYLEGIQ